VQDARIWLCLLRRTLLLIFCSDRLQPSDAVGSCSSQYVAPPNCCKPGHASVLLSECISQFLTGCSRSANQTFPCIFCYLCFNYPLHSSAPPFLVLCQTNPVLDVPLHFFAVSFIIVVVAVVAVVAVVSSKGYCTWFSRPTFSALSVSSLHAKCPAHVFLFDLLIIIVFRE